MDPDKIPAGRELDALVAEKAMGGKWIRFSEADYPDPDESDGRVHAFLVVRPDDIDSFIGPSRWKNNYVLDSGECKRDRVSWVPRYSEDIAAAFEIMAKLGICLGKIGKEWSAAIPPGCLCGFEVTIAETAPLAICRAALKAALEGNSAK